MMVSLLFKTVMQKDSKYFTEENILYTYPQFHTSTAPSSGTIIKSTEKRYSSPENINSVCDSSGEHKEDIWRNVSVVLCLLGGSQWSSVLYVGV